MIFRKGKTITFLEGVKPGSSFEAVTKQPTNEMVYFHRVKVSEMS